MSAELTYEEQSSFIKALVSAFDELHSILISKLERGVSYIPPHHDYPKMSTFDTGLPSFRESGFYDDKAPRDYRAIISEHGPSLLGGYQFKGEKYPKVEEFLSTIANIPALTNYFKYKAFQTVSDYVPQQMLAESVDAYIHAYGRGAIEGAKRNKILFRLARGITSQALSMRLVIPIAITKFEIDRFRISDTVYICKIPKRLQLSRQSVSLWGSGTTGTVMGAATHAFVSRDWYVDNENYFDIGESLRTFVGEPTDFAEKCFGALRIATGVDTGYAQMLFVPKHWWLNSLADLPPLYGTAVRKYPSKFDAYGWLNKDLPLISRTDTAEMARIYKLLDARNENRIAIALRRLNACLTRDDPTDALIDSTIGLEVLLGDSDPQAVSYKLRMRAAALATIQNSARTAPDVLDDVRKVYEARSKVVHGHQQQRKKGGHKLGTAQPNASRIEVVAANLLRFVIMKLLEHPEFLDPLAIDKKLLLSKP